MGISYPDKTNVQGFGKSQTFTKTKISDGTYGSSSAPSGRAVIGGGFNPSYDTTIDFLQIGTTGNATDFGDLSINKGETGCISSFTRAQLVWRKYISISKCDQHNRLCSLCNTW